MGPDLQFVTAEVAKSTADGSPATAAAAGSALIHHGVLEVAELGQVPPGHLGVKRAMMRHERKACPLADSGGLVVPAC